MTNPLVHLIDLTPLRGAAHQHGRLEGCCQSNSDKSQRLQQDQILCCTDFTPLTQSSSTFLFVNLSGF